MNRVYGRYRKVCGIGIGTNKYHLEVLEDIVEKHYIIKIYQSSDINVVTDTMLVGESKKTIVVRKCESLEETLNKIIEEICKIM